MLVTLVGLGCGTAATMTAESLEALRQADCLLGAGRLLAAVPENCTAKRVEATHPRQLLEALLESGAERPCVVYSGDTGFYSGTRACWLCWRMRASRAGCCPVSPVSSSWPPGWAALGRAGSCVPPTGRTATRWRR